MLNISQSNPIKTTCLVSIGLLFWTLSLIPQTRLFVPVLTMILSAVNSFMLSAAFYKTGKTKFPSPFVGLTYWVGISAIPTLHTCWQVQMLAFCILTIVILLSGIKHQSEAIEESFLSTLLLCFFSPMRVIMITGILLLWGYLIIKGEMTWRMWAASLIAVAIRVLIMVAFYHYQILEWYWIENIPPLSLKDWGIFVGLFIGIVITTLLPIHKSTITNGSIYSIFLLALMITGCVLLL